MDQSIFPKRRSALLVSHIKSNEFIFERVEEKPDEEEFENSEEEYESILLPEEKDEDIQSIVEKNTRRLKTKKARECFRRFIRMVIRANKWKISLVSAANEDESGFEKDDLQFDPSAFKSGSSNLTKKAIFILMKHADNRTKSEVEFVYSFVSKMQIFSRYSHSIRRELAKVLYFETFEYGRIIMKEGHPGYSMYFILTGSVRVQVNEVDHRTGEVSHRMIGEIHAGSSFGELALIQRCKRTATIVCKGTSQFLRIDKPDFDTVLRNNYEQEWQRRLRLLHSMPFFSNWNAYHLRHINLSCRDLEYESDSVIVGNVKHSRHVYFILQGFCVLVRGVTVLESRSSGFAKNPASLMMPLPGETAETAQKKNMRMVKKFFAIGELRKGDFFGVGENLKDTYVLATSRVQCIVVPRDTLMTFERYADVTDSNLRNITTLANLRSFAERRLLTNNQTFDRWMAHIQWNNYKKKVVKEIVSRKLATSGYTISNQQLLQKRLNQAKSLTLGYPIADSLCEATSTRPVTIRGGYMKHVIQKVEKKKKSHDSSVKLVKEKEVRKLSHAFEANAYLFGQEKSPSNVKLQEPKEVDDDLSRIVAEFSSRTSMMNTDETSIV